MYYLHDSTETTEDSFTVTASDFANTRRSFPITFGVTIIPVNDEPPQLQRNTGIEVTSSLGLFWLSEFQKQRKRILEYSFCLENMKYVHLTMYKPNASFNFLDFVGFGLLGNTYFWKTMTVAGILLLGSHESQPIQDSASFPQNGI